MYTLDTSTRTIKNTRENSTPVLLATCLLLTSVAHESIAFNKRCLQVVSSQRVYLIMRSKNSRKFRKTTREFRKATREFRKATREIHMKHVEQHLIERS